jgi:co-chaperonin GroES (HSP10)
MLDVKAIVPLKDRVVVRLLKVEEVYDGLVLQAESDKEHIAIRYGEVVAIGPDADSHGNCPGLVTGDYVVFTQYAGSFLPTDDNENLYKLVKGYDIIGKTDKMDNVNSNNFEPTSNRLLVEVVDLEKEDGGIVTNGAKDPRLAELNFGRILATGPEATENLKEGQLIAFDPYVGTVIRAYQSDEEPELRIIVDFDAVLTITN